MCRYPLSVSSHVKILEIIKVLYANELSDNLYTLCIFKMRDCHKKNRCSSRWLGLSSLTSGDGRGAGRLMPMAMIWLISACVIPKEAGNLQYVWRSPEGMKAEPHVRSVEMVWWYLALGSLNVSLNSVICTSKLIEPREGGAGTSCLLL